jgi:caffeoyl-CoA O-methyltransferase
MAERTVDDYINELFAQEDRVLRHIQEETLRRGMPQISIDPYEGRLLQFLAQMVQAKRIVEIGTLAGYSGTWLARALPDDGMLFTVEASARHASIAREHFEFGGLSKKVHVRQGEALAVLPKLSVYKPFDMVFVDADKANYPAYLQWAVENLRPGGIITAHNALRGGRVLDPQTEVEQWMADFNEQIAHHPLLSSFVMDIGDGLAVAIRL